MSRKEFRKLLLLYGSHLGSWPEPEQSQALRVAPETRYQVMIEESRALDEFLASRAPVEPSGSLSERIIAASNLVLPAPRQGIFGWLERLQTMLIVPQPAYVLASMLVLGLLIGLGAGMPSPETPAERAYVQDFMIGDAGI